LKILISSHAFSPSIGGIETVSELLADEFALLGHSVMMMTQTPASSSGDRFNYPVLRRPSLSELGKAIKWCDLFWQNNLSLRTVWPSWLLRKPVVITHQGSYCRAPRGIDLVQRFKHAIVRRTTSVAISRAVAASFPTNSVIIHNPYDARKFSSGSRGGQRSARLIFLGRLVSEKGVDILLQALAILQARNSSPSLTIVGGGPELSALQELAKTLRLEHQVTFTGPKRGEELTALLRKHEILVVPSRYDEPFGVVALEGIACGCVVVGSRGGGLPEAIGPCGLIFQNGDVNALAATLESLLLSPDERERLLAHAPQHLAKFHPATIAEEYLALFRSKLS
jgi:glycogen synthase